MTSSYVATLRQNAGRKALSVEFRHPLRSDPSNQGKPGRKVRKGLGTDLAAAERLLRDLNQLLADKTLHSPAARSRASSLFKDPRVIEIFYDGIETRSESFRELRNAHVPLPSREEGYPRILLIGAPGAGKTTLLRQLMGFDPKHDGFPATSVNRTTTFETEVIAGPEEFSAAVSFMSEEEVDFEIRQSVSAAIVKAIDGTAPDDRVAKVLLERSDMRFRLKYILGDWPSEVVDDDDPYAVEENDELEEPPPLYPDAQLLSVRLRRYVTSIRTIAADAAKAVGTRQLDELSPEEKNAALDRMQEQAEQTSEYSELVSELLDDVREKFDAVTLGRLVKTTTGWPRLWLTRSPTSERAEFFANLRRFSSIDRRYWGALFTPIVNGIRVAGPFAPAWNDNGKAPRLVLIDTEGLGHKASTMPDVPDYIVARFADCDAILLVHKGDAPFSFEGGKTLEIIGATGQTQKTKLVFTRMEEVKGLNIKGWRAKCDYSFSGVRNVADNQLAKSLTPEVARFMLNHLEQNDYYLGSLHGADATPAKPELLRLLQNLTSLVPPPAPKAAFPDYGSFDLLVLALQKGVEGFRVPWRAFLNLQRHSDHRPLPWQSIKAVSRRYAEGFDDGYDIRPASNLLNSMALAIARFLENPISWEGQPTPAEKREILDRIKGAVSKKLAMFCNVQLRDKAQPDWQTAYGYRGSGSTLDRRIKIEGLYERWVPEPANEDDDMRHIQQFIDAVKEQVSSAIGEVRDSLRAAQHQKMGV